jgi:hypothetical protein
MAALYLGLTHRDAETLNDLNAAFNAPFEGGD